MGFSAKWLPVFLGLRPVSVKILLVAVGGCTLRVSSEILAYQEFVCSAWSWLPISALTEMTAVTLFAINLAVTFTSKAPASQRNL